MKKIDYSAIGARIRATREEAELTQQQLAEMCELSTSHIGHIERGSRIPSLDTIYNIACIFNVGVDYFIFDSVKTEESPFQNLNALLKINDKAKVKAFADNVRTLADTIDELLTTLG
jgi:transcriptional regulator with XRE-family HTH domain